MFYVFTLVDLNGVRYRHPIRRNPQGDYQLRAGGFVVDKGTGFVHCAPSHGREDFEFAKLHDLPLVSFANFTIFGDVQSVSHLFCLFLKVLIG